MRTLVDALPASGAVVVTHAASRRKDIMALIHELRGPEVAEACQVIVVTSVAGAEKGLRDTQRPVLFDHTFYLHASFAAIAMAERLADAWDERGVRDKVSAELRLLLGGGAR
jgi:NAD(P)-dependent dehydrogenase (short-subunit alcohol dehydrogenase family)